VPPTLVNAYRTNLREKHFAPAFIPTGQEDVWSVDVYVEHISLSNTSSSSVAVTISDKQGTPMKYMDAVALGPKSVHHLALHGRFFPGGLSWFAGAGSAVVGYIRGRSL
jgi:hypothetical protein